jgi:hypothetical protein
MGNNATEVGGVSFTALGWFTLAKARKVLGAEAYRQLREAIRWKEIRVTRFGNEYLLDDEDYRAWRNRARGVAVILGLWD